MGEHVKGINPFINPHACNAASRDIIDGLNAVVQGLSQMHVRSWQHAHTHTHTHTHTQTERGECFGECV